MSDKLYGALDAASVTPNDTSNLSRVTRGLYVGTSGNVRVAMADGTVVTLANLAGGMVHPLQVRRVYASGTTAADIVALY